MGLLFHYIYIYNYIYHYVGVCVYKIPFLKFIILTSAEQGAIATLTEVSTTYLFIYLFIYVYLGPHPRQMEDPRLGVRLEPYCRPTPQPQQRGIRAGSVTYPAAHSNARSLTH